MGTGDRVRVIVVSYRPGLLCMIPPSATTVVALSGSGSWKDWFRLILDRYVRPGCGRSRPFCSYVSVLLRGGFDNFVADPKPKVWPSIGTSQRVPGAVHSDAHLLPGQAHNDAAGADLSG